MKDENRPGGRRRRLGLVVIGLLGSSWIGEAATGVPRAVAMQGGAPGDLPAEAPAAEEELPALPEVMGGGGPEPPRAAAPTRAAAGGGAEGPPGPADPGAVLPDLGDLGAPEPRIEAPEPDAEWPGAMPEPAIGPGEGGGGAAAPGDEDGAGLAVQFVPVPAPGLYPEPARGAAPVPFPTPIQAQPPADVLPEPLPADEGPTLSLRIDNQDMRRALELLATQAGVNIIPSQGVGGPVSVSLEGVTFDRALDILLRIGQLEARREGDLVFVYTAEEAEAMRSREREPIVRVYHLNYVRAFDLFAIIGPFLSEQGTVSLTPPSQQGITGAGGAGAFGGSTGGIIGGAGGVGLVGGGGGLVGPGGTGGGGMALGGNMAGGGFPGPVGGGRATGGDSYAMHDMVVVRDYPENVEVIDEIVARLDVQPLQVLIEAVIISVELRDGQELGVNFAVVDKLATEAIVSGSGAAINLAGGFSPARVLSAAASPSAPPPLGDYIGDRPGQLMAGYLADQGLKYGFVSNSVAGFIRALETLNKINILASPRLLVLNKQLAEIQLGQRLGYATTFTNLTTASEQVQFIPIGTLLALRPFVSQDGMIRLEVHPERSSGFIDTNGIPQLTTSELTTNIMVPDGATIVIGGLIDSTEELREDGVLGLSRLPFVGPLFRTRGMQARKQELLVLLTPRIINRGGLPEPEPGLPPRGPSGVPNTGPMPGPSLFADAECEVPAFAPTLLDPALLMRRASREASGPASGLRELISDDFGEAGASTADEMLRAARLGPATEGAPATRGAPAEGPAAPPDGAGAEADAEVRPAGFFGAWRAPLAASASAAAAVTPTSATAAAAAGAGEEDRGYRPGDLTRAMLAKEGRGYRPGDMTRAVFAQLSRGREGGGGAPAAARPSPQVQEESAPVAAARRSAPSRDAAIVPTGMATHVVGPGEDFRSIAGRYYGTPTLHPALWAVNRRTAPSPGALRPGMTVLLPPVDVLERVSAEAIEATVRAQSPGEPAGGAPARVEPDRRWGFGLLRRE